MENKSPVLFLLLILAVLSCSSINTNSSGEAGDSSAEKVMAENRILRENLALAERENDVLRNENIQYTDENNKIKAHLKMLESEKKSLEKKYTQDIALVNDKYENLSRKYTSLEKESSARIKELTDLNKQQEEKMTGEIALLNESIRNQEKKYNSDIEKLERAISDNELAYKKESAALNSRLEEFKGKIDIAAADLNKSEKDKNECIASNLEKEKEIDLLKSRVSELSGQVDSSVKQTAGYKKNIDEMKSEIERLSAENARLKKTPVPEQK